jgi:hypothetical protein
VLERRGGKDLRRGRKKWQRERGGRIAEGGHCGQGEGHGRGEDNGTLERITGLEGSREGLVKGKIRARKVPLLPTLDRAVWKGERRA